MIKDFSELFNTPIKNIKLKHKCDDIDTSILLVVGYAQQITVDDVMSTVLRYNKNIKQNVLVTRLKYLNDNQIISIYGENAYATNETYLYLFINLAQNKDKAKHYITLHNYISYLNNRISTFIGAFILKTETANQHSSVYQLGFVKLFAAKEFWKLSISKSGFETLAIYVPFDVLSSYYHNNFYDMHLLANPNNLNSLASTAVNYDFAADINLLSKDKSFFNLLTAPIDENYFNARKAIFSDDKAFFSLSFVTDCLIIKYLRPSETKTLLKQLDTRINKINFLIDNRIIILLTKELIGATESEMLRIVENPSKVKELITLEKQGEAACNQIGFLWFLLACFPIRHSASFKKFKDLFKKLPLIKSIMNDERPNPFANFLKRTVADLFEIKTTSPAIFKEIPIADNLIAKLTSLLTIPKEIEYNERIAWILDEDLYLGLKVQTKNKKGWTPGRTIDLYKSFEFPTKPNMLINDSDRTIINLLYRYHHAGRHVVVDKFLLNALSHASNVILEDGTPVSFVEQKKLLVFEPKGENIDIQVYPQSTGEVLSNKQISVEKVSAGVFRYDNSDAIIIDALNLFAMTPSLPIERKNDIIGLISHKLDYYDNESKQGSITIVPWDKNVHAWLKLDSGFITIEIRHQSEDGLIQCVSGIGDKWVEVKQGHWAQRDLTRELKDLKEINNRLGIETKKNQYQAEMRFVIFDAGNIIDTLTEAGNVVFHWHKGSQNATILKDQDFKIEISDENGWFKVKAGVEIDGQQFIHFKTLLEAKRSGYITLKESDVKLILSKALRDKINLIDSVLNEDQQVEARLAYPLQKLIETMQVSSNKAWKQLEAEWKKPIKIDEEALNVLRDYQKTSVKWAIHLLSNGFGACLADDMGLGKTIQSLKILSHFAHLGPNLVVAPKSVLHNWQNETNTFTPEIKSIILDNQENKAEVIKNIKANEILIIGYSQVTIYEAELKAVKWQTAILDEAQNIKNPTAKRTQAIMGIDAVGKMTLSGTPIENHLLELWSQFNFINPGLLGSLEQFKQKYGEATKNETDLARLRALVSPFIMRRLKKHVLTELPEKIEINHSIELNKEERTSYEAVRRKALKDAKTNPIELLAALTRLRQVCCDPHLVFPEVTGISSKLQEAINLIEEGMESGHKILVFSQFISLLTRLGGFLKKSKIKYSYLDGQTTLKKRESEIENFKSDKTNLFLISLKAGGTGLNLTEADMVIHLDPWWNPAVEDQASDRAHRMGQTQPVTIYRLVTENTIEEKIIALHQEKRDLAEKVLSGQDDTKRLDPAMLLSLLSD